MIASLPDYIQCSHSRLSMFKDRVHDAIYFALMLHVVRARSAIVELDYQWLCQAIWGRRQPKFRRKILTRKLRAFDRLSQLPGRKGKPNSEGSTGSSANRPSFEYVKRDGALVIRCRIKTLEPRQYRELIRPNEQTGKMADLAVIAPTFLGPCEFFYSHHEGDVPHYDFSKRMKYKKRRTKRRSNYGQAVPTDLPTDQELFSELVAFGKRERAIVVAYYPMLLFGASTQLGLTRQQVLLHRAITLELTRAGKPNDRDDNAETEVINGLTCVGFNGQHNARRKRKASGYKIKTWGERAKYTGSKHFVQDLIALSEIFGLVIICKHPRTGASFAATELAGWSRNKQLTKLLPEVTLKIYTEADFLTRWRKLFFERFEPLDDEDVDPRALSIETFREYLRDNRLSYADVATSLGISKSSIGARMRGAYEWNQKWKQKLTERLNQFATGNGDSNAHSR